MVAFKSARGARTLARKGMARIVRSFGKMQAIGRIPDGGIIVRRTDVRRHRYLRTHGLPHSPSLAAVMIEPTLKPVVSLPPVAILLAALALA